MTHDDGKKVDDIKDADALLLGIVELAKHQLQYI